MHPAIIIQPDLLDGLLAQRQELLAHKREVDEELGHLNALIMKYQSSSSKGELKMMPPRPRINTKRPRVRGVLAAARKAIEQLSGPFDKNQLLAKLIELDEEFAQKKITGPNIRNALRLLTQDGVIRVENEATATKCAKYVKAA